MPTPKATFFTSGAQQRLELAVRMNDAQAIRQALLAGAQVNARGRKDATALMIAVDAQADRAVDALTAQGADPNLRATDGVTAVHLAVENHGTRPNGRHILEAVMRAGGDPNTRGPDRDPVLTRFTADRDLDDIRWFKSLGADLDALTRSERPLIADTALAQDWDVVWCLIELGAKYDYERSPDALSRSLRSSYPSADSPLYPFKVKVWTFLKDKGIAVAPLKP